MIHSLVRLQLLHFSGVSKKDFRVHAWQGPRGEAAKAGILPLSIFLDRTFSAV